MFFVQLQQLCVERGVKLTPLVKQLGMSAGNIERWRDGALPNSSTLNKFAEYFGVTTDFLLNGISSQVESVLVDNCIDNFPVFEEKASAGGGKPLVGDGCFNYVKVSVQDLPKGATHGVYIDGDSMEPLIKDGQLVWIALNKHVENGQIGLFVLNGAGYCKRLEVDYDRRKNYLISLNPKYPPIELHESDALTTIGRVLINQ